MLDRAIGAGVPADRVLLDEAGVNTAATARNAVRILRDHHLHSALLVTHYFHGPRARMLLRHAGGQGQVAPAYMTRRLLGEPWYVFREVMGFWAVLMGVIN